MSSAPPRPEAEASGPARGREETRATALATGRARRNLRTVLGVATTLGLVAGPAWAEADATGRLQRRLAARTGDLGGVSLDLRGLHLRDLGLRVGSRRLEVEEIDLRPTLDGILVDVGSLRVRAPVPELERDAAKTPDAPEGDTATERPLHLHRLVPYVDKLRGVPLRVRGRGTWTFDELDLRLSLSEAEATLRPDRSVDGSFAAFVQWQASGTEPGAGAGRGALAERVELALTAQLPDDRLELRGGYLTGGLGRIDGRLEVREDDFAAEIQHQEGRVRLQGHGLVERADFGAELEARAWSLEAAHRWLDARGFDRHGLDLSAATLDGELELRRLAQGWRLHFDDFSLHGLRAEHHRLSPLPVEFARLSVEGDLSYAGEAEARSVEFSGALAHGTARLAMSAHRSRDRVDLDLDLAQLPCQALLSSAPRGLLPALEGMKTDGQVEGRFGLHFDWAEVRDWATRSEAGEQLPAPGRLDFSFPVVERCRVRREAPGIDVGALEGAYRHRFVGAGDVEHERILAPGAPEFASRPSIPKIIRAFTILEDARFWMHDGFDREHIERALWHDLAVGRFARGASTITQQTARNLWLGVDRSLGRKMQEAFLAARLERELDKNRIIELYTNIIELGPGIYGVEAAAQFYFGRSARELNTLEALHLASMAPAPVTYAKRYARGEIDDAWRDHLHEQVRRLRIHGFITREQAREAKREPLRLLDRTRAH